ncbi:MAG: shikimate dehydrogenase [Flavobacteriaceae bacterium]
MSEANRTDAGPRAVVIGHPISHSRSPLIHNYWLREAGLPGHYETADVLPENLGAFVAAMPAAGIIGANLTVPHKELILPIADVIDDNVRSIGASNLLWFDEAGRVCVGNADWTGFLANLDERGPGWDDRKKVAVMFGAGGAARAAVYALLERGFERIVIVNRSPARTKALIADFGEKLLEATGPLEEILAEADFVVNTTSMGMKDGPAWTQSLKGLNPRAVVHDIVYVPLLTPLLAQAEAMGNRTVDGLGMLLYGAATSFEKWFGVAPVVSAELRRLVLADMAAKP